MTGTVVKVCEIETGTSKAGKEWQKQTFVINNGYEYNPEVAFSAFGDDKVAVVSALLEGQSVDVSFNLSSREFNGKYYHNLDAWKVQLLKETIKEEAELDDEMPF